VAVLAGTAVRTGLGLKGIFGWRGGAQGGGSAMPKPFAGFDSFGDLQGYQADAHQQKTQPRPQGLRRTAETLRRAKPSQQYDNSPSHSSGLVTGGYSGNNSFCVQTVLIEPRRDQGGTVESHTMCCVVLAKNPSPKWTADGSVKDLTGTRAGAIIADMFGCSRRPPCTNEQAGLLPGE